MAFNGVIVDLGQSIPSPHHYLVKFWVPQTADDALEYTDRQKQEDAVKYFFCTITCWESRFWTTFSIAGQIYKDVSASRIVSVWPRLVVIQWGSVPACSAALVDYIWLLGWGLDPSVCVCDRWPGANRQMWPHLSGGVCLCVCESKKRAAKKYAHSYWTMMKTLCAFCNMGATGESCSASFLQTH